MIVCGLRIQDWISAMRRNLGMSLWEFLNKLFRPRMPELDWIGGCICRFASGVIFDL